MAGALPLVLTGVILAGLAHRAGAQSGPYCTSDVAFLKNSLGQDPCHVASYLLGQCWSSFPFTLTTLGTTYSGYGGPDNTSTEFWQANGCMCAGPVYNLLSACQDCQGLAVFPASEYLQNCTDTYTGSAITPTAYFNNVVPNGTQIPTWAFIDNNAGTWTRQQAQDNVTASVPNTPASDVASSGSSSGSSGGHKDVGAIVGGTIGGLAGVGAIGLLALWFFKNNNSSSSSKGWKGEKGGAGAGVKTYQGDPTGGVDVDHRDRRHTTTPGTSVMGRISPFVILRGRTPGGRSATSTPFSQRWGDGAGPPPMPQLPSASGASLGSQYPLSMQHRNPSGQPTTPDHFSAMGGSRQSRSGSESYASHGANPFSSSGSPPWSSGDSRLSAGYPPAPSSSSHSGTRPRASMLPEIQTDDYSRPDVYHPYAPSAGQQYPSMHASSRGQVQGLRPRGDG